MDSFRVGFALDWIAIMKRSSSIFLAIAIIIAVAVVIIAIVFLIAQQSESIRVQKLNEDRYRRIEKALEEHIRLNQ